MFCTRHSSNEDPLVFPQNLAQWLVHYNMCNQGFIAAICCVVFNKREVVFYQSTKGRERSPRPFVL
jgi:hypothetical protein